MIRELRYYSGMARGMYSMLRHPPVPDPVQAVREQLAARESRFLETTRRVVFERPEHPYHQMFAVAGCAFADLVSAVTRHGLETALQQLLAAGVYLTHAEFKAKAPIVRSGREIASDRSSFLNPLAGGHFESRSGGSSGPAMPARQSTELKIYRTAYSVLEARAFGLAGRAHALVLPILPSSIALSQGLALARTGRRVEKWFALGGAAGAAHYRAMTHLLSGFGRVLGAHLPFPEDLPGNDFAPVARWLAGMKRRGRECSLTCFASAGVRVAAAAMQAGLNISGTVLIAGGEALTEAKRGVIEAAGCEVYPTYFINEVGQIGAACRQMKSGNCVHLFQDGVAAISRRRTAPFSETEVDSLMFTTLLPSATRFLINAEMDDAGVIEPAGCDCEYSALGMNLRVRDILSYGKLTGQGVTLMGSDTLRILDTVLPARFGGCAGDYQLVENEGAAQTELTLRISPRVGSVSPEEARAFFLAELKRCYGGSLAVRLWKHSDGFRVAIQEPAATAAGKVLPLHTLRSEVKPIHVA